MVRRLGAMVCVAAALLGAAIVRSDAATLLLGVGYWVEYDPNSLLTVHAHGIELNWVITTQFRVSGRSGGVTGTHNAQVMKTARDHGTAVHFQVSNYIDGTWSREIVHRVLTELQPQDRTIRDILGILDRYGYDGVSLDFENVAPADRAALTAFVARLAGSVNGRGKVLTVAVPAKIRDDPANEWNGAFDYTMLGVTANAIIVMAYDEHWSTSPPGPIASAPWVDAVAAFAAVQIDRTKVILGLPFYGYAWPPTGAAEGISMREAVERATHAGVTIQWDPVAQAPFYTIPGGSTVHFENPRSISRKMDIAAGRGFRGVAFWRLGHELSSVWPIVAPYTP